MSYLCSLCASSLLLFFLSVHVGTIWASFWSPWDLKNVENHSTFQMLPQGLQTSQDVAPERFGTILGTQGGVRSENSDKLEFDDPLNENARFLRSQGLQNEVKIVPKRTEKRKKSRASPEKSAQVCRRVPRERSGAFLRETASPQGPPGWGGGSPAPPSDPTGLTCYFLGFGSISGPEASET